MMSGYEVSGVSMDPGSRPISHGIPLVALSWYPGYLDATVCTHSRNAIYSILAVLVHTTVGCSAMSTYGALVRTSIVSS